MRATAKAMEYPPEPKVRAPVLDPTRTRAQQGGIAERKAMNQLLIRIIHFPAENLPLESAVDSAEAIADFGDQNMNPLIG